MGYLPKSTVCGERNKSKKDIYVVGSETEVLESAKSFDVKDGDNRLEVFPAGFWPGFGQLHSQYSLIPPFWDDNIHPMSLNVGNVQFDF